MHRSTLFSYILAGLVDASPRDVAQAMDELYERCIPAQAIDLMEEASFGTERLADLETQFEKECGDEPYCETVTIQCAVHGCYMDERGDREAWESWRNDMIEERVKAGLVFKAETKALLLKIEAVLNEGIAA